MTESVRPFSCTHTPEIPDLLEQLRCTLVLSTYQAGKVILLSPKDDGLVQLPRDFQKPMGLAVSCLVFVPLHSLRGYFAGAILLGLFGFLDDFRELSHRGKFIVQALAVGCMIYLSDVRLESFGDLFGLGPIDLGQFSIPLTFLGAIGVINAMNMIDGLDGLAGGISLIGFAAFAFLSYLDQNTTLFFLSLALCGTVFAFLRYNWAPSHIFMGDSGSLMLGFSLAFLAIGSTQSSGTVIRPVVPLLLLAVPIVDTVTIMLKRVIEGRSPFRADRYHLHHIMLRYGPDRERTVMIILAFSLFFTAAGILGTLYEVPDVYMTSLFGIYFVVYFLSSFLIKGTLKFRLRFRRRRLLGAEGFGSRAVERVIEMIDTMKVARHAKRYPLECSVVCTDPDTQAQYLGRVTNISKGGFSAQMKEMIFLRKKMQITLYLRWEGGVSKFRAVAENAWLLDRGEYHEYGFCFTAMEARRAEELNEYLALLDDGKRGRGRERRDSREPGFGKGFLVEEPCKPSVENRKKFKEV